MFDVVLVPAATLPKTTSGKLRRFAIETAYTAAKLNVSFGIKYHPSTKNERSLIKVGGVLLGVALAILFLCYLLDPGAHGEL
jgi:hypothetical protein